MEIPKLTDILQETSAFTNNHTITNNGLPALMKLHTNIKYHRILIFMERNQWTDATIIKIWDIFDSNLSTHFVIVSPFFVPTIIKSFDIELTILCRNGEIRTLCQFCDPDWLLPNNKILRDAHCYRPAPVRQLLPWKLD